jgi:hypothetical protein
MSKTSLRERWKADQARRKANALVADFPADATELTLVADLADAYAAACDDLEAARAVVLDLRADGKRRFAEAFLAGEDVELASFMPAKDDPAVVAFKAAQVVVHEMRRPWREMGEASGARAVGAVRNNVTDPNDDELAAWWADQQKGA